MSALVAYRSHVQRVTPTLAVTQVRGDPASEAAAPSTSASAITSRAGSATNTLLALLGRTGLWGPDGITTAATPASAAAPAEAKEKLQQALSTLLDVLKGSNQRGADASQESPAAAAPAVDDAIRTILGTLTPVPPSTPAEAAAATVNTDASGQAVAPPAPKPNLDALNRVLAHYTAQSAAAAAVVTLVR